MTNPCKLTAVLTCLLAVGTVVTSAASTPKAAAQKVVFIGDAATYNWRLPANSSAFQGNPKWTNEGLTGKQTSAAILARFQTDVVALHPDIVHILAGAVDISLADEANTPFLIQGIQTNLIAMVAAATHAHIKVILGTIPPLLITESVQQPQISLVFEPTLIQYLNAWIESYGAANGIPVINYHDVLCSCVGSTNPGPSGYYPLMSADGASPSPAGYAAITPLVALAIETLNLSIRGGYVTAPGNASTVTQGTTLQFAANAIYSDGIPRPLLNTDAAGLAGTWTSQNPDVLYVGSNGEAYAYAPGQATVLFTTFTGLAFDPIAVTVEPAN